MLSPKRLTPFLKSKASITNAYLPKPPQDLPSEWKIEKKLFFPTFESRSSIIFWVGFIIFFSLLGVLISIASFQSWWDAWVMFVDGFTAYSCIIGSVVGYVHINRFTLARYDYRQTIKFFFRMQLVIVPLMTLVAVFLTYLITGVSRSLEVLVGYMVSNVILAWIFSFLLIHFFSSQYDKMQQHYALHQRQLIEQNEQLKARITPHFFFNMLNTMQYLIETDTQKAEALLKDVSALYRTSFNPVKEIALLDEIELCEHYLRIEQHRFGNKLHVTWQLPDEDLLYDMVISSLTLQLVIEKMIVFIVEMSTATIFLTVTIDWQNDWVTIVVKANLPSDFKDSIAENINRQLSFNNQIETLRQYYGKEATIEYYYTEEGIECTIRYPLTDVVLQ